LFDYLLNTSFNKGWRKQSPNYDVSLENNNGFEKRQSAVRMERDGREKKQSASRERQNGDSNPTPYSASLIAAMSLCLERSVLRQMRLSQPKVMRPTQSTEGIAVLLRILTSMVLRSWSYYRTWSFQNWMAIH
jgi:hypothetical protein